jgi:hypothetical protein
VGKVLRLMFLFLYLIAFAGAVVSFAARAWGGGAMCATFVLLFASELIVDMVEIRKGHPHA